MRVAVSLAEGWELFEMQLDDGYLPTAVDVDRSLPDRLDPRQFAAAAIAAYQLSVWRRSAAAIARGDYAALDPYPSRRAQLITALDAGSYAEFQAIEHAMRGDSTFTGRGPITRFDRPSMTITAGLGYIHDIAVDSQWAASAPPYAIAADMVDCAGRIREQRPRFHETGSWSVRSDDELEYEVREYRAYLERNR